MTRKIFKTVLIVLSVCQLIFGGDTVTKVGTTASKFLGIGVGSKANGMGNAFVAVANDASAMYWNPAGIAQLENTELIANYTEWLAGISYSYAGLVIPVTRTSNLGISSNFVNYGEMEVTTEASPEGTGETFSSASYSIGATYAAALTDRFYIGGNVKFINETISNCNATAMAVDLGTLFISPFKDIRFGVSISNFGNKMQISGDDLLMTIDIDKSSNGNGETVPVYLATDKYDLPLLLRVGLSGDFHGGSLVKGIWAIDAAHPNDNSEYVNFGLQLSFFNDLVFVRGGMKKLFMDSRDEKLSVGGGLNLPVTGSNIMVDYAFQSFERLGYVHKYTVRIVLR